MMEAGFGAKLSTPEEAEDHRLVHHSGARSGSRH